MYDGLTEVRTTNMFVSVVVVARNEGHNIGSCIESILAQDYPRDKYEIVVVDGRSTDKTQEIVRRHPVKLIIAEKAVIGHQRNTGVGNAQGGYVAFADADCVADRQWLGKLVEALERADEHVVAVGGPNLVFRSDSGFAKVVGYVQETFLGSGGSAQGYAIREAKYVKSLPNCNVLYVRDVLMTERYDDGISCGDDCDLNHRLARKGYKFLYVPDAIVWHHRPTNLASFVKKMFNYGEAMGRVTRKNRRIVRWYALAAGGMVVAILVAYPLIRFVPWALYAYVAAAGLYAVGLFGSMVQVLGKFRGLEAAKTVFLLPTQHLSYGVGFLKGLVIP
jgi:cellulose synthase/poly-beta-1,6-N-acetylglucosamine synthase-like glycosyltransferase